MLLFLQSTIYEVAEPESNRASRPKAQHTGSTRDRGTSETTRGSLGEIRTVGNPEDKGAGFLTDQ